MVTQSSVGVSAHSFSLDLRCIYSSVYLSCFSSIYLLSDVQRYFQVLVTYKLLLFILPIVCVRLRNDTSLCRGTISSS